jgi:polygalacturonase
MLVFLVLYILLFVSPTVTQSVEQFNIVDNGAIGNGATDNTQSIRHTLARAANYSLPSIVLVPAGDFLTGALQLPSNVTLRLAPNAILRASDNPALYSCVPSITSDTGPCDFPFLLIDQAHDVRIEGEGRIDAGANSPPGHLVKEYHESSNMLMPAEWNLTGCIYFSCRPKLLVVRHSYSVTLTNVTLSNSPLWTVTVVESENILFDGITIVGDLRWPNNDGIDLINTRHVVIRNSNISTGDDCIAVVSHGPSAIFNITVENMDLQSTSSAIKISAFEADATGDMYNMIFRDLRIKDSHRGVCVAPRWGSGTISNLVFERMTIETRFFGLDWWGSAEPLYITALSMRADRIWNGTVKNVTLRDIVARGEQGFIFYDNTSMLQEIHLVNISLTIDRWSNQSAHPSHDFRPSQEPQMPDARVDGIFALNINGFDLNHIQIQFQEPKQDYYGQCMNLNNITQQSTPIDVVCRPTSLSGQNHIDSRLWQHPIFIAMLFMFR